MKIEMGESLMQSWLKHIKCCKITQLNWKPSPNWSTYNDSNIENLFSRMEKHFPVFKNSNYKQSIKQAELDVLGIDTDNFKYYAIDIAYHECGLNYGSKEETIDKITQKFLRSVLVLYKYFNATSGEIIFASPKINPNIYNDLQKRVDELNYFLKSLNFDFELVLYANQDFNDEILIPIEKVSSSIADTSELFMRAIQLNKLCNKTNCINK